jgi:carbon-monoxide dehydrogenase large subunit
MKIADDQPSGLSALDRPNSYIGRSVPRPNLARLTQGRGQYVSDIALPRMVHVAFVRSPHAHARIKNIATADAKKAPGVVAVVTGAELAKVITPWVGVLTHLKGIKSAPQYAIAVERACWQGEAVCAVVARSRAQAEDACAMVGVEYEVLQVVTDAETALDAATPVIHPELGDNLTFERALNAGDVDKGFAEADAIVETTFVFGRHTGVTNEARSIVADWNPGDQRLTVYQGTQAPHMTQNIFAKHLGLEEHQVRVLTKDVGGSFGIKVHIYADEMAVVALSKLLKRPVKFVADRLESFVTDIHARDHRVKARIGVKKDGTITAFEIDDLTGIGPYSVYPRTSGIEANQVVNLVGSPYTCPNYRARARVVFQNKNVMCQYRAVGHPIATAVTEGLVELAAAKIGIDPVELRRKNLFADDCYPATTAAGLKLERLSHHASLDKILKMMDYAGLRAEQTKLRARRASRHWLCVVHRSHQSFGGVLRRRRRAYLVAGWRDGEARRGRRDLDSFQRDGAGAGHRVRVGASRRLRVRCADRAGSRCHWRYRQHAVWRRYLGIACCRYRWRGGVAGWQGAARQCARRRRFDPAS